jgi:hypothetical protein
MRIVNSGWFRCIARVLMVAVLLLSSGIQLAQAAKVPSGTPIIIRLADTVSSKTHTVGKSVTGVVANDVVVDGITVIKSGATAMGRVTSATKATMVGIPGNITVKFESVLAVNGATVPLMNGDLYAEGTNNMAVSVILGLLCLLGFLMSGGDAVIGSGTTVNALTIGEIIVN